MIDFSIIFVITLLVAGVVNLFYEFKRDLMMYQQNSYRNERYMRWLSTSGDTTSLVRLLTYIAIMVMLVPQLSYMFCCCVALIPLCINVGKLIVARYKKPLVWTNRVKRIFAVASLLSVGICVAAWFIWKSWYVVDVALLVIFAMSHVIIMLSGILLKPVEASINRKYYNEAASILRSMPDLTVIGVTGSYGKTSTKHYLNRILSEKYDVLMTPGSYNTTMGVIRTVREMMKPYNEIFICEMGAKNIGDIKEICDLVHPSIGIVTAVGEQHLESFKTIENVQRTKFELVDSLPENGLAVINDDFPFAAS
ncbi:Mur ligase family protein, partial [uncultured Muribaculum sp.]